MATRDDGSRGIQRTLRDLLPITAAAAAAALGVAIVMTPAASFLDRSFSGRASDIPTSVSAPVARLLSPGDITVRVRPGRPAPSVALVDSAVSPVELVTGRPAAAGGPRGSGTPLATGTLTAGAGVAGPTTLALPAPEPAPPSVPADVEVPAPAPALAAPVLEAAPDKPDDGVSAVEQRKRPSRPLREATSAPDFSIAGAKTTSGSKTSQLDDSSAGATRLASFSVDHEAGSAKSNGKSNAKGNDKDHPGQGRGQDEEAKKRNPKPERK